MLNTFIFVSIGIGIGLYFRSSKAAFVVALICACIALVPIYQNLKTSPTQSFIDDQTLLLINMYGNVSVIPEVCPTELLGSAYGATRESKSSSMTIYSIFPLC